MIPMELLTAQTEQGRFYGIYTGIVTEVENPNNTEEGQKNLGRVKVKFPWLSDEDTSYWARIISPIAGNQRGLYFLPKVNDEVLVAFEHGLIEFPCVMGSLWNSESLPPVFEDKDYKATDNQTTIKSASGHTIILNDTKDNEQIIIQAKTKDEKQANTIVFDCAKNSLTISVTKDTSKKNQIVMEPEKITLTQDKTTITIAKDEIAIEAKKVSVKCDAFEVK
jgi:uncharacterized protein involved in type VI secretion and phage assembly